MPPRLKSSISTRKSGSTKIREWQAFGEELARARDELVHQRHVAIVEAARFNIFGGKTMAREEIERNVDSVFLEIARDVLPEIRELQRGASGVGKCLALGVAVAAQIEHEAANRIRGIAAVTEHVVPGGVARDGLILAKRCKQIGEGLDGNFAGANRGCKRDENGMSGFARIAAAQHDFPILERGESLRVIGNLVGQIVGPAAIGVHVVKMLMQAARQEPRDHTEIFVVMAREMARVSLGLFDRAALGRQAARDFEFLDGGGRHVLRKTVTVCRLRQNKIPERVPRAVTQIRE